MLTYGLLRSTQCICGHAYKDRAKSIHMANNNCPNIILTCLGVHCTTSSELVIYIFRKTSAILK